MQLRQLEHRRSKSDADEGEPLAAQTLEVPGDVEPAADLSMLWHILHVQTKASSYRDEFELRRPLETPVAVAVTSDYLAGAMGPPFGYAFFMHAQRIRHVTPPGHLAGLARVAAVDAERLVPERVATSDAAPRRCAMRRCAIC